jgi:hypothetical protein
LRLRRIAILGEQIHQIEPAREHRELAVGGARPGSPSLGPSARLARRRYDFASVDRAYGP